MQLHRNLLKKDDLANIKSEFDNLDIDELAKLDARKLKPVPVDLSKLSGVVKNYVVRKDEKKYQEKYLVIRDLKFIVIQTILDINMNSHQQ